MSKFHGMVMLGVRDKETDRLVAAYPELINADEVDAEKKIMDWYYMQDCDTSENIENVYVDRLSDKELKGLS